MLAPKGAQARSLVYQVYRDSSNVCCCSYHSSDSQSFTNASDISWSPKIHSLLYRYRTIVCFLYFVHGIRISYRQLKRVLNICRRVRTSNSSSTPTWVGRVILPVAFHTSSGYSTDIPQIFPLISSLTRIQLVTNTIRRVVELYYGREER